MKDVTDYKELYAIFMRIKDNKFQQEYTVFAQRKVRLKRMKQTQADKVQEITEQLEQGYKMTFLMSQKYADYLKTMSKLHNYSFNNSLLIAMQKPNATMVAGYTSWKVNFHRNVMKGEKGIRILAPSPYKISKDVEKIDPETKQPMIGKDGEPIRERIQVTIPAYRVTTVFDVFSDAGETYPRDCYGPYR